jgi:hypothetical protein
MNAVSHRDECLAFRPVKPLLRSPNHMQPQHAEKPAEGDDFPNA